MTYDPVQFIQSVQQLSEDGDYAAALQKIRQEFPNFPQEVQSELLTKLYVMSLADKMVEEGEIESLQQGVVEILEVLEK